MKCVLGRVFPAHILSSRAQMRDDHVPCSYFNLSGRERNKTRVDANLELKMFYFKLHADEIKTLPSKITPRSRRSRPVTAGHRENHRERSSTLQTPSRSSGRPAGLTRSFSVHQQVPKEIHERLLLGDKLGSGYFAEVKFAIDRKTGDEVAVKIIDKHKCRGKEHMVHDEIRLDDKVYS